MDRMQGEEQGCDPFSAGIAPRVCDGEQPLEDEGQQDGAQRMEQDGYHVVAERVVAPEPVLEPECAVEEGIILLRGSGLGPDERQSME